jgi:hypothetical protein
MFMGTGFGWPWAAACPQAKSRPMKAVHKAVRMRNMVPPGVLVDYATVPCQRAPQVKRLLRESSLGIDHEPRNSNLVLGSNNRLSNSL